MFKELFTQNLNTQDLNEVLITLGKKAYPKFGNIVILAGGAASGKGFVKEKLLGIEGKSLDVDQLKIMSKKSALLKKRALDEHGININELNLKNAEDVTILHGFLDDIGLDNRKKKGLYASVLAGNPERRPNIIFDVTLKSITKLDSIVRDVSKLGYKPENIHIVWIVNDVKIALIQNSTRERTIKNDILIDTHEGAALTMRKLIGMGQKIRQYMDGAIVLTFNKRGIDTGIQKSENGGEFIIDANYVTVKEKGLPIDTGKINKSILTKIQRYVPKSLTWNAL